MKKHLILTSLVAIVATGAAYADETKPVADTVTFGGYYGLVDGSSSLISADLVKSDYKYDYTDKNGDSVTGTPITTGPDVSLFKYQGADDDYHDYEAGKTIADDFTGASVVLSSDPVVSTTQVVAAQNDAETAGADRSNYKYKSYNAEGTEADITLGEEKQTFVKKHEVSAYAGGTVVTVTDGVADTTIAVSDYHGAAGDTDYTLNYDNVANEYFLSYNGGLTIKVAETTGAVKELADDLVSDYEQDADTIGTYKTNTATWAATEAAAFADANGKFGKDDQEIKRLTDRWLDYSDSKTKYDNAVSAKDDVEKYKYKVDDERRTAAAEYYQQTTIASVQEATLTAANEYTDKKFDDYSTTEVSNKAISEAIDDLVKKGAVATNTNNIAGLQDSIDTLTGDASVAGSVDNKVAATTGKIHGLVGYDAEGELQLNGSGTTATTRLDSNGHYNGNLAVGTTIEDHLISLDNGIGAEAAARSNADQQLANQINDVANGLRSDFAAADALTLRSANAYTDDKVNKLEKDMSGGVAAATALSAVNVGNVKKGEVSVGGGYGYYNSQSAMAFGAAMGLSDNWSVNAGAGIASGDKTQMTFRAGTNYKFKLF